MDRHLDCVVFYFLVLSEQCYTVYPLYIYFCTPVGVLRASGPLERISSGLLQMKPRQPRGFRQRLHGAQVHHGRGLPGHLGDRAKAGWEGTGSHLESSLATGPGEGDCPQGPWGIQADLTQASLRAAAPGTGPLRVNEVSNARREGSAGTLSCLFQRL